MNRYLLYLFTLTLLACTVPPSQPKPPTAIPTTPTALSTPHPTQPPIPTATPQVPTAIPIPTTLTNPTIPITTEPTLSSLPPFTEGQIYFLWSPHPPPEGEGDFQPTLLYQAIPSSAVGQWQMKAIGNDWVMANNIQFLPNKLALLVEDITFSESFGIYLYDFATQIIEPLTDTFYIHNFAWLPNKQGFIYPRGSDIFFTALTGLTQQLTDNGSIPPADLILNLFSSPNGKWVILNTLSTTTNENGDVRPAKEQLILFDVENNRHIFIADIPTPSNLTVNWATNSHWVEFHYRQSNGLWALNTFDIDSQEIFQLAVAESCLSAEWSPNGQKIAFSCGSQLFLWDMALKTTTELAQAAIMRGPLWSPDGSEIVVGFEEGERKGLLRLNPITRSQMAFDLGIASNPILWSPDGQWILTLSWDDSRTRYYLIHYASGESHLFLDTTALSVPHHFIWLLLD